RRLAQPDFLARVGVEAGDDRVAVPVVLVNAAADVDTLAYDGGARVAVQVQFLPPLAFGGLPELLARDGIDAIHAVVAGAEVDLAADDHGRRFGVAVGGELPQLLARLRVDAVEVAALVRVETFADVDPAVRQHRATEHLLHGPVVV